jgi:sugar lactone lactonase YvrE
MGNAQSDPVYGWTNFVGRPGYPGSTDGVDGVARFDWPAGVAVDNAGNVYVADHWNHAIRKVTPEGEVTTLAGRAGNAGSADGTGSAARFKEPLDVTVDAAGNVFVADTWNFTIRKVTGAGEVTTLAGRAGNAGSADGTGSAARFYWPFGVAVDATGNVYVADAWNQTIRKVTPAGEVTTLAGLAGTSGSADGIGSAARFNYPGRLAIDLAGNLYVPDYWNHTLRKVTTAGEVTTLAGSAGSSASADGTGGTARFFNPESAAVDGAGNIFVADAGNHTIRKVAASGMVTTVGGVAGVIGGADGIGSAASFSHPSGVAVDSTGTLYVADQSNHRITKGVPLFPPVITVQPASRTNNPGTTATLSVTATGSAPLSYQWSLNGTILAGATDSSLTLANVQITDAGSYSIVVTNAFGSVTSSNALLTVNLPPTVSISSPTNGSVMLAPATFTLLADATDDLAVAQVEFWSGTNSLGTVTNAPWYVLQTNLLAGEYLYTAVAMDTLGLASTSAVHTVTVLSQPPTEAQALVTDGPIVRQTGLFYQTVRVSNPTLVPFAALRLWVELDANSLAHGVQVWNAIGRSKGVPYLSYNVSLAPSQSVDLRIEYYVPDRQPFSSPSFRTEVVVPDPPFEPAGTALGFVRQVPLADGLFLVEFSTTAGWRYYVQYSSDMTNWKTALPAVMGTGSRVQWIDNGPPKTESLPSSESSRFYRVILLP